MQPTITINSEIQNLAVQLKDAYEGEPWFGKSVKALLSEVDERIAFEKPKGQHSILQLLWHMRNWREFVISRIKPAGHEASYFEINDWQELDHSDKSLWKRGLENLDNTQTELLQLLHGLSDDILDHQVGDRNYTYRKMIVGITQHDIYHLGQIAYITKMLKETV